jgi:hypothetical protein
VKIWFWRRNKGEQQSDAIFGWSGRHPKISKLSYEIRIVRAERAGQRRHTAGHRSASGMLYEKIATWFLPHSGQGWATAGVEVEIWKALLSKPETHRVTVLARHETGNVFTVLDYGFNFTCAQARADEVAVSVGRLMRQILATSEDSLNVIRSGYLERFLLTVLWRRYQEFYESPRR